MESFVDCVVQKTGSKHTCIPVHYHRDGLIVCHTTLIAFSIFRPADREYYTTTLRHYNVKCVSNGVGRSMQSQTRVITISQYNDDNMIRYYIL